MPAKIDRFSRLARHMARVMGNPVTFTAAVLTILIWAALGPVFQFSDSWQLVINTGTTIVTFLMVFLIQNTQNRDSEAMQVKLDELIRTSQANNVLLDLEELSQAELDRLQQAYETLAAQARKASKAGQSGPDNPLVKPG